jgi:hypothetical protein
MHLLEVRAAYQDPHVDRALEVVLLPGTAM